MPPRFQLVARTGQPDFLDLPWDRPLEELESDRLASVVRGIGRHVVRFVDYGGTLYALKELPTALAWREYRLLLGLRAAGIPVVDAVGVVAERGEKLDAVLITRHLEYSLPLRALFARGTVADLRQRLLDASAELLVRLHVAGFFWGDCSLSNTLFRRDAGTLSAYLVDAETGELHPALTDGQRRYDLAIACENFLGELLDVEAEFSYHPLEQSPEETADELAARYERLWDELTREEVFGLDERFRVDERLRRLNDLGFDVEELELVGDADVYRLRLHPRVVEPGHHRRRLLELTGLRAQENQARRMLNDLACFRADLEQQEGRTLPSSVVTARWLDDVFESAIAAVPQELFRKREAAEIFHEILDHRWYLSQDAGRDIGLLPAVESYVEDVLRHEPDEHAVLDRDLEPEPTETPM
ncbi:MAG: DUF4032 domain-containing protein [Actinobacteria bacterium]|nr:MAG: DUF4032 domain-containing protein [Actinomycetota bacterium]